MPVAIVDYGLGNLFSINQACAQVGLDAVVTSDPLTISASDGLILPGVGAFADAMQSLQDNGLIEPVLGFAHSGKPFLGICLGMQLLFTHSEEFGLHNGLDLIQGKIVRFPELDTAGNPLRVPQIQWNRIHANKPDAWDNSLLNGIPHGTYMHFVHSYYAQPEDNSFTLTFSEYGGIRYASSVKQGNITGVQYHPEKSGEAGLRMYRNWAAQLK
jgi:glutamine amidotransferase